MEMRKAFFMFGLWVLVWSVFWQGALRTIALRKGNHPAAKGLLFDI